MAIDSKLKVNVTEYGTRDVRRTLIGKCDGGEGAVRFILVIGASVEVTSLDRVAETDWCRLA